MAQVNPTNAAILCDYLVAEQNELNIKESTKESTIKRDVCYHAMANDTSARPSELLNLRISDIEFKVSESGIQYPMKAEKKHSQPFDFENYAKLFFSANEIPQSEDKSYAYFRRWIIFFFENVFEGDNKDHNLIDRLTTQQEMSGLLNLALIALKQLFKDNGFILMTLRRSRKSTL